MISDTIQIKKGILMKLNTVLLGLTFFSSVVFATEQLNVDLNEVKSYTLQKYKANFEQLNEQEKSQVTNEYFQTSQIVSAISKKMETDIDLKVITKLYTVDIWAKKFMAEINPKDDELKKIYAIQKPITSAKYTLRNIVVQDEKTADRLIKDLNKTKELSKTIQNFKEFAKSESIDPSAKTTEGEIGIIEANKLDPKMRALLNGKKAGDLVKIDIPQIGWQILLIEGYEGERVASFEESKSILIATIRQESLKQEIEKLITHEIESTKK